MMSHLKTIVTAFKELRSLFDIIYVVKHNIMSKITHVTWPTSLKYGNICDQFTKKDWLHKIMTWM